MHAGLCSFDRSYDEHRRSDFYRLRHIVGIANTVHLDVLTADIDAFRDVTLMCDNGEGALEETREQHVDPAG